VILDFTGGAFAGGQLYVALSRCRSLEGIVLKSRISPRDVIVNHEVVSFSRSANDRQLIEKEIERAKADEFYRTAIQAFKRAIFARQLTHSAKLWNDAMNWAALP
jgi:hypothetical protein